MLYLPDLSFSLARCQEIYDTINSNPLIFTNVTAQDLTDMSTAIRSFSDNMMNTQMEIAEKKGFTEIVDYLKNYIENEKV